MGDMYDYVAWGLVALGVFCALLLCWVFQMMVNSGWGGCGIIGYASSFIVL